MQTFKIQNLVPIEDTVIEKEGKKHTIKAITLKVNFSNVDIKPFYTTQQEIEYFLKDGKSDASKQKLVIQDTNIPNHARKTGKTLKVDVVSSIVVTLAAFDNVQGLGDPIDSRREELPQ